MSETKLTTPSYLVLGMVEQLEPVTPYQLKALAAETVSKFWALPHTQIYTQCDRLLEAGLLSESREVDGRRRRSFSITKDGAKALEDWRHEPVHVPAELRDLATLKLFFGTDPKVLADDQLAIHQEQLDTYLEVEKLGLGTRGQLLALKIGIAHEREFVKFWKAQSKA